MPAFDVTYDLGRTTPPTWHLNEETATAAASPDAARFGTPCDGIGADVQAVVPTELQNGSGRHDGRVGRPCGPPRSPPGDAQHRRRPAARQPALERHGARAEDRDGATLRVFATCE
jgi:hypothetical protein